MKKKIGSPHVPDPPPQTWSNCLVVGNQVFVAGSLRLPLHRQYLVVVLHLLFLSLTRKNYRLVKAYQ